MWIPVTLLASLFQVVRTSRQHKLREVLSVSAAGFVRYAFGFPLAATALAICWLAGVEIPVPTWGFWPRVLAAGLSQIVGTVALLRAFDLRDFAIGTVYSKTEVIQVAAISAVLLNEPLRPLGWVAGLVCLAGVAWLAAPGKLGDVAGRLGDPAAWMGALAGAGFAGAAVGIRASSGSLGDASAGSRALVTLTLMLGIQTLINGIQLLVGEPGALRSVAVNWRAASPVGVLSLCGSACWAIALTLSNAAKVRTLGQIELIIAFAISAWWLGEEHTRAEYVASTLVAIGIVGVVVLG